MAHIVTSRTLAVSVACPPRTAYAFVSNPENLPRWAAGLCRSVRNSEAGWIVETPSGPMRFRFAETNTFGVLDHYVITTAGVEIYVPLRVVPNGAGSEILFTLFKVPGMSDEQFADDAQTVARDLQTLKEILES